ncbi:serine hydrolase domain-containing protein [Microtetraspora fusca]|uniref:Serine hydrolase domain-containing protein n=1 Tax=Microtetraspora fusca TaxID=1997 RepID=A0ABW6UWV9_MICFU
MAHAAPTAAPPRWPDTAPAGPRPDLHRGLGGSPARPGHGSRTRRDRHRKEGRKRPQSLLAWCRYSNTDYILLGLIAEKMTRQSLAEVFHQRVFAPLHLDSTYMPGNEVHIEGRHVRGYMRLDRDLGYIDTTEFTPSESWSAGAIVSTPLDLAVFLDALLGGRLLEPQWLTLMRATPATGGDLNYGMGMASYTLGNGTALYGHGGTHFGVDCYAFRSDAGRAVIIYQNSWDRVTRGIPR